MQAESERFLADSDLWISKRIGKSEGVKRGSCDFLIRNCASNGLYEYILVSMLRSAPKAFGPPLL